MVCECEPSLTLVAGLVTHVFDHRSTVYDLADVADLVNDSAVGVDLRRLLRGRLVADSAEGSGAGNGITHRVSHPKGAWL